MVKCCPSRAGTNITIQLYIESNSIIACHPCHSMPQCQPRVALALALLHTDCADEIGIHPHTFAWALCHALKEELCLSFNSRSWVQAQVLLLFLEFWRRPKRIISSFSPWSMTSFHKVCSGGLKLEPGCAYRSEKAFPVKSSACGACAIGCFSASDIYATTSLFWGRSLRQSRHTEIHCILTNDVIFLTNQNAHPHQELSKLWRLWPSTSCFSGMLKKHVYNLESFNWRCVQALQWCQGWRRSLPPTRLNYSIAPLPVHQILEDSDALRCQPWPPSTLDLLSSPRISRVLFKCTSAISFITFIFARKLACKKLVKLVLYGPVWWT